MYEAIFGNLRSYQHFQLVFTVDVRLDGANKILKFIDCSLIAKHVVILLSIGAYSEVEVSLIDITNSRKSV